MASAVLPKPGEVVDRYEVIMEVARGGMAAVFAVRRKSLGGFDKTLALKMLLPDVTGQRQAVERFLDEARIASRIAHPNVVEVIDVSEHEGLPYILMELLRGQSLAQVARAAKRKGITLPLGFRLSVLARAAEGLAAAHTTRGPDGKLLGIVHRDVSPQNIHVSYDGEVKVVDFGIAAARGRLADTTTGEFRGKLAYAAPEQLSRQHVVDARADIWALGVVGFELLSGRRLFRGEDERDTIFNVVAAQVPPLGEIAPAIPAAASAIVMRCLDREIEHRLADASELARVLDQAAVSVGGDRRQDLLQVMSSIFLAERAAEEERLAAAARGDAPPPPLQPGPNTGGAEAGSLTALSGEIGKRRRSRWPLLAGVAAVLVVAAGAVLMVRHRSNAPSSSGPAASGVALRTRVRVEVPDRTRLVLVDGRRRDDRPLTLDLGADESAKVEVVAADGRTLERTITAKDDGLRLELPAVPEERAEAPPGPASASASPSSSGSPDGKKPASIKSPGTKKSTPTSPLLTSPY